MFVWGVNSLRFTLGVLLRRYSHKRGSAATLLLWLNRLVAEPDRGLAAEVIQSLQIPELGVKFSVRAIVLR